MQLPSLTDIEAAAEVVYRHLPPTPQYRWPLLADGALVSKPQLQTKVE